MPFNTEQLAYGAKAAIDFFLKNDPVDNINIVHPLYNKLISGKTEYGGAQQYVVEQIRFTNDSNFQSYFGDSQVSYNRKRTLDQAKFAWGSFHDGFGLNEDELAANGVTMTDDRNATPTEGEKVQLTNLLEENMETLKTGFQENFDLMLHRDGSQSATDIAGLDSLIALTPTNTVGTLDGNAKTWWRNYTKAGILADASDLLVEMAKGWRACIRVGGSPPDFIIAGTTMVALYEKAAGAPGGAIQRHIVVGGATGNKAPVTLDAGVGSGINTGLYYKGVEILWDPVFDTLDTLDAPAVPWAKRMYFINSKYLKLRPIKGQWLVSRRPPRVYDRYVHYFGLTAKASLTTGKRNAHAVLTCL